MLNEKSYKELKEHRAQVADEINKLQLDLFQSEGVFNVLDSIFNPKVSIQEVNNPRMGHRFLGKCRVIELDGKSRILGFSVGKADNYKGKDDPKLMKDALNKAKERIRKVYPNYFT